MSPAALSVDNFSLMRGQLLLCHQWQMRLQAGQCVHLAGANGCGKTSFFQAVTGLLQPEQGDVYWHGQALAKAGNAVRRQWHYCTHDNALKEALSVTENALLAARLCGVSVTDNFLEEALQEMQLFFLADTPVLQLSQGQKRRASLLRLKLVPRPVWLLDEPFNALDEAGRHQLAHWMNRHCEKGGSVLFTSHFAWPGHLKVNHQVVFGKPGGEA